jgi:hypothetical protein
MSMNNDLQCYYKKVNLDEAKAIISQGIVVTFDVLVIYLIIM